MKRTIITLAAAAAVIAGATACEPVAEGNSTKPKTSTAEKSETPKKTEAPAPTMTRSQEQAVGTAEDYLDGQHFSRSGLIDQLEFEDFSKKDATFAVDYLKVNWNEQAVGTAEDYLDGQHFSRSGLIDQLEFEGFTKAQAEYGVKKAY